MQAERGAARENALGIACAALALRAEAALVPEHPLAHDALGRRVLKDTSSADTRYIYNGWQCVEEYTISGETQTLKADYVYGNNIDEVLQMRRDLNSDSDFLDANEVVYYHTNVQGNTVALTNSAGVTIWMPSPASTTSATGSTTVLDCLLLHLVLEDPHAKSEGQAKPVAGRALHVPRRIILLCFPPRIFC